MTLLSEGSLVTKTPMIAPNYFPHMPPMAGGWSSAYGAMFRRHLWVYTVIGKRARGEARLPLPVYERNGQDRVRTDKHPMAQLLANPNPATSRFRLWNWTRATRDIYGEAFWLKRRIRGVVKELYPLHPASMTYDERTGLWNFDNGTLRLVGIEDNDLVHFFDFDPDSLTRGMSPLEPLRSTLENEWSARVATSSFWQHGARPGTALTHPGTLGRKAQKRLKAQWDDMAAGAHNTGTTVVLEEGMKPERLTLTAEEAQYIDTRKLNREEVCGAYDIPPPVVHILDRATFSNITEQMRSMYRDSMAPLLNDDEATLELELRRAEWPNDDVYAEFLMDEVLRGDFESRQDAYAKATHMTIAEKRKAENLPFIPGTDRIFLNTATLPLDAIDAQAAAIVAQTGGEDAEVIPMHAVRSVMGRLGWQQTLSQVDPVALIEGLGNSDSEAVLRVIEAERAAGDRTVADLKRRIQRMAKES